MNSDLTFIKITFRLRIKNQARVGFCRGVSNSKPQFEELATGIEYRLDR